MRLELGPCLLTKRLEEAGLTVGELSGALRMRPERIVDFQENKRIMPLRTAINIAAVLGCGVQDLYVMKQGEGDVSP